jgi:hypothetical protein
MWFVRSTSSISPVSVTGRQPFPCKVAARTSRTLAAHTLHRPLSSASRSSLPPPPVQSPPSSRVFPLSNTCLPLSPFHGVSRGGEEQATDSNWQGGGRIRAISTPVTVSFASFVVIRHVAACSTTSPSALPGLVAGSKPRALIGFPSFPALRHADSCASPSLSTAGCARWRRTSTELQFARRAD